MRKHTTPLLRQLQLLVMQRLHGTSTKYVTHRKILTIPNVLTGSGIIVTILYVAAFTVSTTHTAQTWWLPLLAVYVMASDVLDGILADALNQHSVIGKVIDPLRDRLLAGALLLHIAVLNPSIWLVLLIIGTIVIEIRLAWIIALSAKPEVHAVGKLRAGAQWAALICIIVLQTWFAISSDFITFLGAFTVLLLSLLALLTYSQQSF